MTDHKEQDKTTTYLRPQEVAARFSLSESTLATWRSRYNTTGVLEGPKWFKRPGGRLVLYRLSDCEAAFLGELCGGDDDTGAEGGAA